MNIDRMLKQVSVISECLVKLDRQAHKKFGDEVYSMQVKDIYADRFTAQVVTKDGKKHRMTVNR